MADTARNRQSGSVAERRLALTVLCDACTPDAMRLCASAIPDVSRVSFCLAHNKQQLSSACAAVFNRPRGASATRERRENIQKTNF